MAFLGPDVGCVDRRTLLSLVSAVLAGAAGRIGAAVPAPRPVLATPDQIEAERILLGLLADPGLKRIQAQLKADLAATPRGRIKDAAATLDNAIAQWTNSLIFAELVDRPDRPVLLWGTDDTPRSWLGHRLGGVGTSGDNPDAIYRTARIDGAGRYELLGRFDPSNRPAQLVLEIDRGTMAEPAKVVGKDVQTMVSLVTDRDLAIAPDGSFRIAIGGRASGPNQMASGDGPCMLGVRDLLADWKQRPSRLTLRRLDPGQAKAPTIAELKQRIYAHLPGYVRFWAGFPDIWMGGLKPNTIAKPMGRYGGWGFVAGLRFQLAPDQAIVVTTNRGGARYTGSQLIDPWMIAPDARKNQVSLNLSQATPNADGSYTYVVASRDPGVANWLDTVGMQDGFGILRWQAVPKDATAEGLIGDFRVVPLPDLAKMLGLPRVSPAVRRARVAARAAAYSARTT